MSEQRQKSGQAIAEQQTLDGAKPPKKNRYIAILGLGLATSVLAMAGMGVYVAHLHKESIRAERVIRHLEVGQEFLIEDRDFFTTRVRVLEAGIESLEQRAEEDQQQIGTLSQDKQELRDEVLRLAKNTASDTSPDSLEHQAGVDLGQMIAEKDAKILELSAENMDLRVRMYELANAFAISEAASHSRIAEVAQKEEDNG